MQVTEKMRKRYAELCPLSFAKCINLEEVDFKIKRAVTLGLTTDISLDGSLLVQYYHNQFVVKDGSVITMNKTKKSFEVKKGLKKKYNCCFKETKK